MAERSTDSKVQLGGGTLIIIALFVMIFSGGDDAREMREQLEDVSRQLARLEKKVDELSRKLDRLPEPVERK